LREVRVDDVIWAVRNLCIDANTRLPEEHLCALRRALEDEESAQGREVLEKLLENAEVAREECIAFCQDTGYAVFFIELGTGVRFVGGEVAEAIDEGVRRGYDEGYLRKSIVRSPIERTNTGDNTPAIVYYDLVPGDGLKLTMLVKGAGCDNMSALKMLTPAEGLPAMKEFVVQTIEEAGPNASPPLTVGVGIGGPFEKAAQLAKRPSPAPPESQTPTPSWRSSKGALGGDQRYRHRPGGLRRQGDGTRGARGELSDAHRRLPRSRKPRLPLPPHLLGRAVSEKDPVRLETPLSKEDVQTLESGHVVRLNGMLYVARDAAHARMAEAIENEDFLPFDPEGQVVYFTGPAPARPGHPLGPAGPTTASRMDPYSPLLIERGLRGMIGKGMRSEEVREAMREHGCVYFGAVEGTAALLARRVREAEVIAYEDLGAEAVRRLVVEDFPVIVINDLYGGDLYLEGRERWRRASSKG
jgi:tartrate/fumarate subfamily iron-sulfur-dependent hydro-lyase alpha chain/tartrate/fumarate subfamily iron-sulfur-dependent hydro-lyase beta chain